MMGPRSFPLIFIKNGTIQVCDTCECLHQPTRHALRHGWFSGLFIVDAGLQTWKIARTEQTRDKPRTLFPGLFAPKVITVVHEYEGEPVPISLQDLKQRICDAYDQDPDHWEEYDDLDALKRRVMAAKNFNELCQLHR